MYNNTFYILNQFKVTKKVSIKDDYSDMIDIL